MDVVVERCAGLDVHKDTVVACVRSPDPQGGRLSEVRTFGTFTVELLALRDWLLSYGVTLVAMESTGVFWRPVFYLLEDAVECWVVNAAHMRNLPGRKTDVADAEWIAQLVEHGLVRPSFVPPPPIRELRSLTRYRKAQIEERTREVQRLDLTGTLLDLRLAVPRQAPQLPDRWWGHETGPDQAVLDQLGDPLRIRNVGLAPGQVPHVRGVDHPAFNGVLEQVENRPPKHPGGLHRDQRHPIGQQPVT